MQKGEKKGGRLGLYQRTYCYALSRPGMTVKKGKRKEKEWQELLHSYASLSHTFHRKKGERERKRKRERVA